MMTQYWPPVGVDGAGEWRDLEVFICNLMLDATQGGLGAWIVTRMDSLGSAEAALNACMKQRYGSLMQVVAVTWKDGPVVPIAICGDAAWSKMEGGKGKLYKWSDCVRKIAEHVYRDQPPEPDTWKDLPGARELGGPNDAEIAELGSVTEQQEGAADPYPPCSKHGMRRCHNPVCRDEWRKRMGHDSEHVNYP